MFTHTFHRETKYEKNIAEEKTNIVKMCTSSSASTGFELASALAIVISNLGKRMMPPDEN